MKPSDHIENAQSEANSPKHKLIEIMSGLEKISPRKAKELGQIIERLERWQNTP